MTTKKGRVYFGTKEHVFHQTNKRGVFLNLVTGETKLLSGEKKNTTWQKINLNPDYEHRQS